MLFSSDRLTCTAKETKKRIVNETVHPLSGYKRASVTHETA